MARHSEEETTTRHTEKKNVARQYQGMDRPGFRQISGGSGEWRKMEETGCEVIYGAPATPPVQGEVKVKKVVVCDMPETMQVSVS